MGAWTARSAPTPIVIKDRAAGPQGGTCQGDLVRRIIAALRRSGADCCVVLTEGETLH